MRRQRQQSPGWLVALVCLASLTICGQPASGRSIFDQLLPFNPTELTDLLRQGGEIVDMMRQGASVAYDELSSSFSDFVSNSATGYGHSHNQIELDEVVEDEQGRKCKQQDDGSWLCAPPDPDAKRNVFQIIQSRGFHAQQFDVTTRDGYILTIQRIVNPNVDSAYRKQLKPVILQHGLMSSSVDWVINSVDVRPSKWPRVLNAKTKFAVDKNSIEGHQQMRRHDAKDSQEQPNSLGFYLANEGYDVFLANSRGNVYGQKHVNMSSWMPKFWDFSFDEQIKYDLPDTIEFVQKLTGHTKVGYVGHSQGTTMALGLLADRPEYGDIMEPVVLLAPVAYANNCLSPVKYFAVYTPIFQHINMWFGSSNFAVRYLAPKVCGPKVIRRDICANIIFLSSGFDEAQFNDTRVDAYLSHMPSGTSVKNIAHWGQEVLSGRFAHFDHGILGNQMRYKSSRPPAYELANIRSKSLVLFTAENDWLASPKDVARLKHDLANPPYLTVNVTEFVPAWNHLDFLYGKDCGRLVNTRIVDVFHQFDK